MSWQDFVTISPLLAGILTAAAILIVDLIRPGRAAVAVAVTLIGLTITAILTLVVGSGPTPVTAFGGAYKVDDLTTFFDVLFVAAIALTIAFGPDYLVPRNLPVAEFAAILVFAMTGAMLIAASGDLLMLFLGLELMVLPGYLLAAFHKSDGYSTEGAIKYFLLGSFSSAIFLFGLAFVWGLTGTIQLTAISEILAAIVAGTAPLSPGSGDGPRLPDDRRRVQDRGRAVPLLDARRLPGLPDPDHRLPVGRAQGRRVRADPAAVRGGARAAGRLVDACRHRAGDADDDPRQPGRADPGQRQADARLQLDRAHRLHARRAGRAGPATRWTGSTASRPCSSTASPTRS